MPIADGRTMAMLKRACRAAVVTTVVVCLIACGQKGLPDAAQVDQDEALAALLPASGEITGWSISTGPEFFGHENLWDYINGQADFYLDYGFRRVVVSEYASNSGSKSLVAEIYLMGTPEEAFGIFAAERSPGDRSVDIGAQGYATSNVVNYWKGACYVKLTSYSSAPGIQSALVEFGRLIAARMEGESSQPPLFAVFPDVHRVVSSERFIPRNFLGQPYLNGGYRVDYESEGDRHQLVLVDFASPDQAADALARYARFLDAEGADVTRTKEATHTLVRAQTEAHSLFFQVGSFMGGVVNIDNVTLGEELVREMVEKISATSD